MRIDAVIPTFNEEDIIEHTIRYLRSQHIQVTVLDNESTDRTVEIAKDLGVSVRTFSSQGLFDELLLQQNLKTLIDSLDTDWVIKNDADEYMESPYAGVSLREGIEMVARAGKLCIGVTTFLFYPMSHEPPHIPGTDVRAYYDYFKVWDKVDRWDPSVHPDHNQMWKTPIYNKRAGVYMTDPHQVAVPGSLQDALFPDLFILRHYPYRDPQRTYQRLIRERRDRLSKANLDGNISNHYLQYTDDSDIVQNTFLFDGSLHECERWSKFVKKTYDL